MLIFKRFLVFSLPFLTLLTYLFLFLRANWYYYLFCALLIIILLSTWYLLGQKLNRSDFFNFLFSPVFFIGSSLLFFTFLESLILKVILIVLVTSIIFIFYNKIFQEFYRSQIWQLRTLKNILFYLQILSLWFLACAIYGLIIFINFSIYLAILLLVVILLIFFEQFIWYNELDKEKNLTICYLIFLILIVECSIIIKLLPISLYFKGLIMTVIYYLFTQGFLATKAQKVINKAYSTKTVIFILILLILIIISNFINW